LYGDDENGFEDEEELNDSWGSDFKPYVFDDIKSVVLDGSDEDLEFLEYPYDVYTIQEQKKPIKLSRSETEEIKKRRWIDPNRNKVIKRVVESSDSDESESDEERYLNDSFNSP